MWNYLFSCFAAVYITAKVLFHYPTLLHKKKVHGKKGKIEVIAHRGSRMEGLPENSLAAFKDAIQAGADVIELDVWLSTDGKVVVHHDEHLTRMSGGSSQKAVRECDHCDLPELQPPVLQRERCHLVADPSDYQRIPLLSEVLALVPSHITVIVEFKQNSDELIQKAIQILDEHNRKENMYWFSLIESINAKLRIADPSRMTIVSIAGMLRVLALYYTGLLPFFGIPDGVLGVVVDEVPLTRIQNESALKSLPPWVHHTLAFLFQGRPPAPMNAPKLFNHLRARGIPVWFMGVNTETDLLVALEAGATAVLTDRVNWLCECRAKAQLPFKKIQ